MTFIGFANDASDLIHYLEQDYDIISILELDDGSFQVIYKEMCHD